MWTALLLAAGCGAPPVPPSDEEMTQHFLAHEAAFETLREVIARCPYGMYYPPYDTQDTACLKGISTEDRHRLDSLLAAISCERVFYYGKEAKKEAIKKSGWDGQDTHLHELFHSVLLARLLDWRDKQGLRVRSGIEKPSRRARHGTRGFERDIPQGIQRHHAVQTD